MYFVKRGPFIKSLEEEGKREKKKEGRKEGKKRGRGGETKRGMREKEVEDDSLFFFKVLVNHW